ncbi:toxin CptA [Pseudomonas flavescens]|uniref:Toxin CptA n=1 Tax=Phytopseudomonas flavescens TaxID=29435 RepID=A0A1G8MMG9_9GAMM|nr:protein YgfX [Pseudomonas flavescens]SDI69077.1 toxin CptA [Pseudomonas flavescens]
MSSPSKRFECQWQPSRRLLEVYLCAQALAVLTLLLVDIPLWAGVLAAVLLAAHAAWVLPLHVLQNRPGIFRGLRHDDEGWQVRRDADDWQPVTLMPDSIALPWLVVVRFRLPGQQRVHSFCLPADSMSHDAYRRLRVHLKFSRQRWRVAE